MPSVAADNKRERERVRQRRIVGEGQEIGPIPKVENPRRRKKAAADLLFHCETYHASIFNLKWSADHLKLIAKLQEVILRGGQEAFAMPRGTGKTSIVEVAAEWAILHAHRRFVTLIGATEAHANEMLSSIKRSFEDGGDGGLLLADFPEAVYPVQMLDGSVARGNGQTVDGVRTRIQWKSDFIVLAKIKKSRSSGACIRVCGITGRIRGMKQKRPDGGVDRPDLAILDDPQTDESAKSVTQSAYRAAVIAGAVLGLSGPGKKIAAVMPCTIIRPGDMADQILDREKHPEWNGERTKMVYSFPTNDKLWDEYRAILADGMRNGDRGAAATEFYRQRRAEMDAGSEVAWPERHNEDELSAIQNAMNLRIRDERAFFAEYQNEPLPEEEQRESQLTVDAVCSKLNGFLKKAVPVRTTVLTTFIDVQQKCMFYAVAAWEADFTGYVIDYGSFPDQKRSYFALRDARHTLAREFQGTGLEGMLYAGLEKICDLLLAQEWKRDDGAPMRIGRCLIDQNWGLSTNVVRKFCRQSKHAALLTPSHGAYVGARSRPIVDPENEKHRKEARGLNWRFPRVSGPGEVRHVTWDTNYWKSFVARGLQTAQGDRGCLSLWGKKATDHLLFGEHCTAEFATRVTGPRGAVEEWQQRPGRDNHWWDCLIGCAVAASVSGIMQPGVPNLQQRKPRARQRVSYIK